jgi:hypothetical protein
LVAGWCSKAPVQIPIGFSETEEDIVGISSPFDASDSWGVSPQIP